MSPGTVPDAPWFDDLVVGQTHGYAPSITLTDAAAAVHRSIVGGRLRPCLDARLTERITGRAGTLASPALAWDVAIGQSTQVTQRVIANLFYRGLQFHRLPLLGDTLTTVTRVEGLRSNTDRPGRAPTGLAVLRMTTTDQDDRRVLDFWRCAMLPRREAGELVRDDDLDGFGRAEPDFATAVSGWYATTLRREPPSPPGELWDIVGGDVVSSAPELARLTLNVAMVHHDITQRGKRLVYGGQTIGLALHQATRALPDLLTVTGWHSCDHTGPVYEGDTLVSRLHLDRVEPRGEGLSLYHLRSIVSEAFEQRPVLDWRFVALVATA